MSPKYSMIGDKRIRSFLSNMEIKLCDGDTFIDLMDLFPEVKKGIYYPNTISTLLRFYIRTNNIPTEDDGRSYYTNIIMDKSMKKAFPELSEVTSLLDLKRSIQGRCARYT